MDWNINGLQKCHYFLSINARNSFLSINAKKKYNAYSRHNICTKKVFRIEMFQRYSL